MGLKKITIRRICCVALACVLILFPVTPASAATARATTMKLEKTEGTVSLKTQNGTARKISNGMRLYNGNTLKTQKYSYAYINLDNTKAVKLDQSSFATLRQSGRQLELLVKSGKLFFNVSKPLKNKESMNVRTSTMVTGIRGTCGVVEYLTSTKSKLYLIEGKVTLGTGENAVVVEGGQTATVILQEKSASGDAERPGEEQPGDKDDTPKEMEQKITVEKLTEETIPSVALPEIVNDPVLQEKIEQITDLQMDKIEEALEQFEKEEAERKEQEQNQEENKDTDKDTEEQNPEDSKETDSGNTYIPPAPGGSGGSSSNTPTATEITLGGDMSATKINAALSIYKKVVVATTEKDAAGNVVETNVTLEDTVSVPAGKVLVMQTGKFSGDGEIQPGNGVVINEGNMAAITGNQLLSVNGMAVYAPCLNQDVADYLNEKSSSGKVTATFYKKVVVPADVTIRTAGSADQSITLDLQNNQLCITSGTLTLNADVAVNGTNTATMIILDGGNLKLDGTSQTSCGEIRNSGGGYVIGEAGTNNGKGTFIWNDTGRVLKSSAGTVSNIIIGVTETNGVVDASAAGYCTFQTGYLPEWDANNNQLKLTSLPATFASGNDNPTVTRINTALKNYGTVTIGENALVSMVDGETINIPANKTLEIASKQMISNTGAYTTAFCVPKGASITIGDGAQLKVSGAITGNGTISAKSGSTVEVVANGSIRAGLIELEQAEIKNNGTIDGENITSTGSSTITNDALIKLSGAYTSNGTDTYSDSADAVLISKTASTATAMSAGKKMLMAAKDSSGNELYYYYAQCLCKNVIDNMSLPTGSVTWEFAKDAVLPAGDKVEMTGFHANLNGYELQVKGTLTLFGETNITGFGSATVRLMSGGNLILAEQSDAVSAISCIENTKNGYAIASDGGSLTWNDIEVSISGADGVASAIQNATVSGEMVTLPGWVTVKTGYGSVWQNNKITLQSVLPEFTSGTVSAADLNQALQMYQTVTIGTNAKANLSSTDTVTIPQGKTLIILSKVTPLGTNQYSGGFYLGKSTSLTLEESATLNVESGGFFGGNGIVAAKAGAKIEVKENGTLQADEIKLAANSSITNHGLIDGGSITSEGNAAVTNHTLIRLQSAYNYASGVSGTDTYTGDADSALLSVSESNAMPSNLKLVYAHTNNSESKSYYCYATYLNPVVASYMNDCTNTFYNNAIIPTTTNGIELKNITADLGIYHLEVQGNVTFTGTLNMTGEGENTIYLNGGAVTLNGTSETDTEANVIKNISSGYVIGYASGSLVWNDTSLWMVSFHPDDNYENIIQGYSRNADGSVVQPKYLDSPGYSVVVLNDSLNDRLVLKKS